MNILKRIKLRKIERTCDRLPIDQEHHEETSEAVNTTQRMALTIEIKEEP